jgi:Phasin protein.
MFDHLLKQNEAMMKSMQSMMDMSAFEDATKPMATLLEMQRAMLETMAEQQTALTTELMSDCLDEARAVCQCDSMPEMMEIHKKYLSKYQEKMAELAKQNAQSMTQMSEETLGLIKKNTEAMAKSFKN